MSNPKSLKLALLLAVAIALAACSRRAKPDAAPAETAPEPGIYRVDTGERLSRSQLFDALESATYVVVGEQHTSKWQHRVQADIYRALLERSDGGFALGMEMFQRPFQESLDLYARGKLDEATMLERTEWKSRWGTDPALYRPLWRAAREHGAPVIALNAPRELSRAIARAGLDGLSADQRSRLPSTIVTSIEAQRQYVRDAFERHDFSDKMDFQNFLEAQATWDETMAATAIEAVETRNRAKGIVIVAGRAHARRDFGIPRRIERRLGDGDDRRVVSVIPYRRGSDAFSEIESAPADYVWLK